VKLLRPTLLVMAALFIALPATGIAKKVSPVKKNATYAGKTEQGSTCVKGAVENVKCDVQVKTSSNGKKVAELLLRYHTDRCEDGSTFRSSTRFTGLKISNGKFAKIAAQYNEPLGTAGTANDVVTVKGTFKRSKTGKYSLSGSFQVTTNILYNSGVRVSCLITRTNWSAKLK
jgi:hypothetical protein